MTVPLPPTLLPPTVLPIPGMPSDPPPQLTDVDCGVDIESRSASAAYLSEMAEKFVEGAAEGVEVGGALGLVGVADNGWRPTPGPGPPAEDPLKGWRGAVMYNRKT